MPGCKKFKTWPVHSRTRTLGIKCRGMPRRRSASKPPPGAATKRPGGPCPAAPGPLTSQRTSRSSIGGRSLLRGPPQTPLAGDVLQQAALPVFPSGRLATRLMPCQAPYPLPRLSQGPERLRQGGLPAPPRRTKKGGVRCRGRRPACCRDGRKARRMAGYERLRRSQSSAPAGTSSQPLTMACMWASTVCPVVAM